MTQMLMASGGAAIIAMEIFEMETVTKKDMYVVMELTQIFRKLCRKW